jgi:hypothetical protein
MDIDVAYFKVDAWNDLEMPQKSPSDIQRRPWNKPGIFLELGGSSILGYL